MIVIDFTYPPRLLSATRARYVAAVTDLFAPEPVDEREAAAREAAAVADWLGEPEDCPHCPNQGWYGDYESQPVYDSDENGYPILVDVIPVPVQVQCEFCWTNPRSKFNATRNASEPADVGTAGAVVYGDCDLSDWSEPSEEYKRSQPYHNDLYPYV